MFHFLVENGAIELSGVDANGDPVYHFTEKCAEDFPDLWELHKIEVNQTANELWQIGLIEMVFEEDTQSVMFNLNNYRKLQEVHKDLTHDQISFLETILDKPLSYYIEEKW